MIIINIPGYKSFTIKHLVMDYNGTLAVDGKIKNGVVQHINKLSSKLEIHIITADTFGIVKSELKGAICKITVLSKDNQIQEKLNYINKLGKDSVVAFGNGRNDQLMLKHAALGIAVMLEEGCAIESLISAKVLVKDIKHAFDLLNNPLQLSATLRS